MIGLILHTLSDPIIFCPAFSSLQIFKLQHQMTSTTHVSYLTSEYGHFLDSYEEQKYRALKGQHLTW